ncbi:hypothetical protein KBB12_03475 [Candidatus Woesebacteria bacterium]|nr:hypothetical protein [Candidatus Woesebacteria bacterium]
MKKLSIPLLAAIFNLFFEYSLRGVNSFVANPFRSVFLFLVYFLWFVLVEDLIRKYKPNDWKAMLIPYFGIGTIYSLFFIPIKAYFTPPFVLGVNVGLFVWCTLFWWTLLQTTMTLYFANRLAPRNSFEPLLSKKSRLIVLGLWLFVGLLFRLKISYPPMSAMTYLTVFVVAGVAAYLFFKTKSTQSTPSPSRFMDVLTGSTVVFFLIAAFVFSKSGMTDYHPINVDALGPVVVWTTVSGAIMLAYRLIRKKPFLV